MEILNDVAPVGDELALSLVGVFDFGDIVDDDLSQGLIPVLERLESGVGRSRLRVNQVFDANLIIGDEIKVLN